MPDLNAYGLHLGPWTETLLLAIVVVIASLLAHRIGSAVVLRITRPSAIINSAARSASVATAYVLPLAALQLLWQAVGEDLPRLKSVQHVNGVLLLMTITWLALRLVRGASSGLLKLHPVDGPDNLGARRIQTQARVLSRVLMLAIVLVGSALVLMTFPEVRQVGASLLASAGVVGLVAGIAARPVISNLIAGLQIALGQPIRIDDVLIVQNEWGRVEEITGTYVVLRIWDERRLIIPLQWFIENPFQNWTRTSAQIMGTVFVWVDYRMPLAPLREEAQRVCREASEWDGRVCMVQVVEAGERAVQLRWLVTSARSDLNWDLRCKVREALVDLMQREYSEYLPLTRAALHQADVGASPDPLGRPWPKPSAAMPGQGSGALEPGA